MELTLLEIFWVFLAGVFATLLGGMSIGLLVYKTKYAGGELFHRKDDHGGAEVFNLDSEFTGPDKPEDYKKVEYPSEIEESVAGFEKQFGMERMIKAAETYNIEESLDVNH